MTPQYQSRNVILISAVFFFVFAGFSAGQQYLTILFKRTGEEHLALVSLFLLYGTFLLAGTVVAKAIPLLGGLKRTLSLGACIYGLFIASIAFENTYLLLFSSVVMGFGGALLWVSSGKIIGDSSSNETAGRNFAYQVVAQNLGSIAGLMIGAHLLRTVSFENMYLTLAAIVAIGAILTLFVKPSQQEVHDRPFNFFFLRDRRMLTLFPLLFGTAFLAGQSFTAMNTVVVDILGIGSLALIIGVLKGGNILGSLVSGVVADAWSKMATLIITVALAFIGIVLFVATHSYFLIFTGAILMGIAMASVYPVCLALLKEHLKPEEYVYSLGVFHVYNNVGAIAAILTNMWLYGGFTFLPGVIALLFAVPGILLFPKMSRG